ncbi:O-antigen ligase family protein [Fodinicola acaciae]|uniref:O-antigen ligase family protein n=1 Tax=Fodinicola acaciae TaxID=2681555 RepID=UPI0013D3B4BA|nr:O-antigen ligase family protein [Fodinicola acaciae]
MLDVRPRPELLAPRGTAERAALLAVTASVVFQPILHPAGPGNSSPVDVFLLLALLATAVWASTSGLRLRAPYVLPVAVSILAGALSGLFGPLPQVTILPLVQDAVLVAWCVAIVNVARQPGALRVISRAWAVSATIYAGVLVGASLLGLTAIEGIVAREGNRALFTFGDPNYAATYWVSSIFLVFATGYPANRWLRRLSYLLLAWSLVLTESNGGMIELAAGAGLLLLVTIYRRRGLVPVIAVVLAAGMAAGGLIASLGQIQVWARDSGQPLLVNSLGRSNASSAQRTALITESLQLYATAGLLGSGPSTTKQLLADRQYPYAKEAHDDLLAALIERGPLGAFAFVLLAAVAAWRATVALRAPPTEIPRPVGVVAGLLAMAVASAYYEVLHFRYVWLLLALVAVLAMPLDPRRTPAPGGPR